MQGLAMGLMMAIILVAGRLASAELHNTDPAIPGCPEVGARSAYMSIRMHEHHLPAGQFIQGRTSIKQFLMSGGMHTGCMLLVMMHERSTPINLHM